MSNASDPRAAGTTLLAPHQIEEWQTSETSHKSVRRLTLMRGEDAYEWYADQVLAVTKYLTADRGGTLESLEITQFVPDAGSTEENPPPIGEVFTPVAHSLTSIWIDVPNEVGSGTLLGIMYNLPKLQEVTIYAPTIRKSLYQGEVDQKGLSTVGKLGLLHLDVGGDLLIEQLIQHEPLGYHAIGLSHNKLIDSYNSLVNASGGTLKSLSIQDIEERHFKRVHDNISVANCFELSELTFGAGEISEAKTTRMIAAVLSTVTSILFEKLRISYQLTLDSEAVNAEADSPEWDAVDEELVRIASESDCQIEVTFNSLSVAGGSPIQASRFLSRFQEKGTVRFTFESNIL